MATCVPLASAFKNEGSAPGAQQNGVGRGQQVKENCDGRDEEEMMNAE